MSTLEIVLLILGALIFVISFVIPEKLSSKKNGKNEAPEGRGMPDVEPEEIVARMKGEITMQVREAAAEAAEDAAYETRRNLEKLTNEKMMALDDYARTVLSDVEKNHKEVMFLYDMLNNKSVEMKNLIRKAESTKELKQSRPETKGAEALKKDPLKDANRQEKAVPKLGRDVAAAMFASESEEVSAPADRNDRVLELYHAGVADVEIAKKLGIGVGEVRLVIGLAESQGG
ncbi:MAG: hypothetical protein K5985_12025 [Lachnospiraceae bacterium]|nr:hypothetical protein [Lachnospiraceae bacterium]